MEEKIALTEKKLKEIELQEAVVAEEHKKKQQKKLVEKNIFPKAKKRGKVLKKNLLNEFAKTCLSFVKKKNFRNLKVVVDFGNGMASLTAKKAFAGLPIKVIPLCYGLDGSFPNHEANPLVEQNRKHVEETVIEKTVNSLIEKFGTTAVSYFNDRFSKRK